MTEGTSSNTDVSGYRREPLERGEEREKVMASITLWPSPGNHGVPENAERERGTSACGVCKDIGDQACRYMYKYMPTQCVLTLVIWPHRAI